MFRYSSRSLLVIALGAVAAAAHPFADGQTNWFIGIDSQQTIPSGMFAGLPNPNFGRLTFLYGHQYDGIDDVPSPASSHFHSKSRYVYANPNGDTVILDRPTSNFVPEDGTRIELRPGSGATAGLFVSGLVGNSTKWANTRHSSVAWLNRPGAEEWEQFLFASSGGRWSGSLGSANVGIQLVDATPGLALWSQDLSQKVDAPGEFLLLGQGDALDATPVFSASGLGSYSASFRLVDLNTGPGYVPIRDSGVYEIRFEAVPEPATLLALGAGVAALAARRRRRS